MPTELLKHGGLWTGLLLIALPLLVLVGGFQALIGSPLFGLPLLAIFGISLLWGAFSLVAVVFAQLGLSDKTQALALPEGSIRAAMALSLVVLFAIIAMMLFQSMSLRSETEVYLASAAEKDKLKTDNGAKIERIVPAKCREPANPTGECYAAFLASSQPQAGIDLGKQLLVLVGTLMTSVVSFYFAARGAAPAGAAQTSPPFIKSVGSAKLENGCLDLKLTGVNLELVHIVRLAQKDKVAIAQSVTYNDGAIDCQFGVGAGVTAGSWMLSVTDIPGRTATLAAPLEVA